MEAQIAKDVVPFNFLTPMRIIRDAILRIRSSAPIVVSEGANTIDDPSKGGGTYGFDTHTESFMCLCDNENSTTHCKDYNIAQHNTRAHVIAGIVTDISVVGAFGI
ncbi:hypothetical protein AHAS_Ahas14G0131900 [Arachis hypogaea]